MISAMDDINETEDTQEETDEQEETDFGLLDYCLVGGLGMGFGSPY